MHADLRVRGRGLSSPNYKAPTSLKLHGRRWEPMGTDPRRRTEVGVPGLGSFEASKICFGYSRGFASACVSRFGT